MAPRSRRGRGILQRRRGLDRFRWGGSEVETVHPLDGGESTRTVRYGRPERARELTTYDGEGRVPMDVD